MASSLDKFARRLERVERDIRNGAVMPRLAHSAIDGGSLELKDHYGNTAGYIGEQFDGTVTAAAVAGSPPSPPTVPYVIPVPGGLRIYWDGTYVDGSVTRMDFRRVTFHVVTDPELLDPLDPAQIVGEITIATGGEFTVSLPYVEHYVFAVTWTDAGKFSVESDPAFGTPLQVGDGDVDPAWTYMGPVAADQLATGNLSATLAIIGRLATAGAGRQVSLSSGDGLRAVDPSGETVMHVPTDLDSDISMQADLVAKSITALGAIAMRAADNEIAAGATLILRSATAAPVTPPIATIEWDVVELNLTTDPDYSKSGAYHPGSDRVYISQSVWGASFVKWYNASTGVFLGQFQVTNFGSSAGNTYSVGRFGDRLYCHIHLNAGRYVVRILDAATGEQIHEYELGSPTLFAAGRPATMINDLGQLVLVYSMAGGITRQEVYNRDTGALLEGRNLAISNLGSITALYQGPADTGIYGTWMQSENRPGEIVCCDAVTGARAPGLDFPVAYGQRVAALWWDTIRGFASQSAITGDWHRYDGTVWFGSESPIWFVTNTWRDTDPVGGEHETGQGPPLMLAMKKRAKLFVTAPPIPSDPDNANTNDPNAISIYIGRAGGTYSTQWRQAMPAAGVRSALIGRVTFNNADTTHPNPPQFGDFPLSTPARITDASGDYYFDGNGDAKLKSLFVAGKNVATTEGATLIGVSQWDSTNAELWRNGKVVTLRFDVTATSPSSAGQPVANFPTGWAPPGRLYFFAMDGVSAAPVAMFVEATGNGLFHVGAQSVGQRTVGSVTWLLP